MKLRTPRFLSSLATFKKKGEILEGKRQEGQAWNKLWKGQRDMESIEAHSLVLWYGS